MVHFFVYILDLDHGKFYVGSTKNLESRLRAHIEGKGAEFTKVHKPLAREIVSEYFQCFSYESDEEALSGELMATLQLMDEQGIENVRGGPYCEMTLSDATKKEIQRLIDHLKGQCYKCHKRAHVLRDCQSIQHSASQYRGRNDYMVPGALENRFQDSDQGGYCRIL